MPVLDSYLFFDGNCAEAMRLQALLWAVHHGRTVYPAVFARRFAKPIEIDPSLPTSFYAAIGLRVLAGLAMRPDRLEQLAAAARRLARAGPFALAPELAAMGTSATASSRATPPRAPRRRCTAEVRRRPSGCASRSEHYWTGFRCTRLSDSLSR